MRGAVLDNGIQYAMAILFIGICLAAGIIGVASMSTTYQSTLNSNASLWSYGQSAAVGSMGNGSSGLLNLSIQLPTVGTIAGVGLIILVLFVAVGAFVMGRK